MAGRTQHLMAFVRPDELVLSTEGREASLKMLADCVYVSVASLITQARDCFHHSLTACRDELRNTSVKVKITDAGTGGVLVSTVTTTFDEGFIGCWLPRNIVDTIEITHVSSTASSLFSTGPGGATCITDLHLI